MTERPRDYDVLADVFTMWWRSLQRLDGSDKPIRTSGTGTPLPPNRQALAELRRIGIVDEDGTPAVDVARALSIPAFGDLIKRLRNEPNLSQSVKLWLTNDRPCLEPFAIAAATLARVREDSNTGSRRGVTAKLLGSERSKEAKEPLFAEARFKRLVRCRNDWPDLMAQARRIAAILEKKAPIGDLGASLVLWNTDPHISRDWAFQYYQRDFEKPADDEVRPVATESATPAI